jgi:hypothetical protein
MKPEQDDRKTPDKNMGIIGMIPKAAVKQRMDTSEHEFRGSSADRCAHPADEFSSRLFVCLRVHSWFPYFSYLALFCFFFSAPAESQTNYLAPGTRKMARLLEEIAQKTDPMENRFLNIERSKMLRVRLAATTNLQEKLEVHSTLCQEILNAGQSQEAFAELERFEGVLKQNNMLGTDKSWLRTLQAVALLRLGEQENCLTNHNIESCLFPIQGAGVHKIQRGSRSAVTVLTNYLAETPADLTARWLLNIAAMTLGEHPDKVPKQWLIPASTYASDYDIKHFRDVSPGLGLDFDGLAGGVIWDDFDGDGYLDLINSAWGARDQLRYFHNDQDGTFSERTKEAGLIGECGGLNLIQTDYNNDGFLDFFILRGAWAGAAGRVPDSLMRNNGNGTFDDVTEEAGLLSSHPSQTAVWFDYNNDGWIDLFVGNESSGREVHRCQLFRNNKNGTFTECADQAGVAVISFIKGVAAGDFNNDGRLDLYLSSLGKPNMLFRNDGPRGDGKDPNAWKFTEIGRPAGVQEPLHSFPTWFWDYDNDGWLDIFVSGYKIKDVGDVAADYLGLPHQAERARLYRNNQNGTFTDVTKSAHLFKLLHSMGSNFGDLDNDGFLDFYLGTGDPDLSTLVPNRMFRNADGKFFQDVTTSGGFGHLQKGHGVAFADIDNDGDQDVYEDMGGAFAGDLYRNVLFENPGHGNHWITLKLEGVKSNRAAIGARVRVTVLTANGERTIYKTVNSGGSFGASPLRREIGLGQAKAIKSIEIFWPTTAATQVLGKIEMDQFLRIREGDSQATRVELKNFKLSRGQGAHGRGHILRE